MYITNVLNKEWDKQIFSPLKLLFFKKWLRDEQYVLLFQFLIEK